MHITLWSLPEDPKERSQVCEPRDTGEGRLKGSSFMHLEEQGASGGKGDHVLG